MYILEAHSLQKSYREKGKTFTAVRNVSLTIAAGEVLAFLGPNGAGKTTSIKMIAGLILPDGGWVRICDRDPHTNPDALRCLGAVLEGNRNIYWRLTPLENLEYFGVLRGLSARGAKQRAEYLLERFRLQDKRRTEVKSLSRGMQQKLAIAVALMHEPPLLLLDEPTLGLDVEATEEVKRLIREIVAAGCAILLTTHQLTVAEALSDRVAIINKGEIIAESATAELIRQFSGAAYQIETAVPIDRDRQDKLAALGVTLSHENTVHIPDGQILYAVLEILKPLPLLSLQKDQANLMDIFLKLIRQDDSR
jgi:ABC-2 type transport system ATP-binding protein